MELLGFPWPHSGSEWHLQTQACCPVGSMGAGTVPGQWPVWPVLGAPWQSAQAPALPGLAVGEGTVADPIPTAGPAAPAGTPGPDSRGPRVTCSVLLCPLSCFLLITAAAARPVGSKRPPGAGRAGGAVTHSRQPACVWAGWGWGAGTRASQPKWEEREGDRVGGEKIGREGEGGGREEGMRRLGSPLPSPDRRAPHQCVSPSPASGGTRRQPTLLPGRHPCLSFPTARSQDSGEETGMSLVSFFHAFLPVPRVCTSTSKISSHFCLQGTTCAQSWPWGPGGAGTQT